MAATIALRKVAQRAWRGSCTPGTRCYSSVTDTPSASTPMTSPFAPRHLLSTADLSSVELTALVRSAQSHKQAAKSGSGSSTLVNALAGQNIAMIFDKRSTRTRVSTESAIAKMGGSSMFLGKEDIQLGVNESLFDTSVVISSMVSAIVARIKSHADVAEMAKSSSVPVLNALTDDFHPLQSLADCLTISEAFQMKLSNKQGSASGLGLQGLKLAWVGDSNNVLFDLAIAAGKLGMRMAVASPQGYGVPERMRRLITESGGSIEETGAPQEAIKDANVIITDTWISMGQEEEKQKKLKAFAGYQITTELVEKSGAHPDWKFMHCLPRHPEEVADEVFYNPARSLVFTEAENRLWAMIAALEAFVVNKGQIS